MSETIDCIKCYQPDIPITAYYIPLGSSGFIKVFNYPWSLDVLLLTRKQGKLEIAKFDAAMMGEENET